MGEVGIMAIDAPQVGVPRALVVGLVDGFVVIGHSSSPRTHTDGEWHAATLLDVLGGLGLAGPPGSCGRGAWLGLWAGGGGGEGFVSYKIGDLPQQGDRPRSKTPQPSGPHRHQYQ